VSKGYPYDEDEFDAPVDPDGPHGVHRAPRSFWSKWWPFFAVIIIVPALTFAAVYWAMQNESQAPVANGTVVDDEPGGDETDDPGDETDAPGGEGSPVLTTQVMVINAGSGKTGLAGDVANVLKAAGFTTQNTPGNATKGTRTADTVYYESDDLKVTAEAVAAAVSESQGHDAKVEQGLPTVEVTPGEQPPEIIVMLVNKPRD